MMQFWIHSFIHQISCIWFFINLKASTYNFLNKIKSGAASASSCFIIDSVAVWKFANIFCLLHSGVWSLICVRVFRVFVCTIRQPACWCICLLMKRVIFPPPFLLGCGTSRSRCTGIQINSIERSLIVPLRPARKLKLTMGVRERKRMRAAQSSKEEEAGITKGKKTTQTA